MPLHAVLFDFDGVLNISEPFSRLLERDRGITLEMTRPFFRGGGFEACSRGRGDLYEELAPYLPGWGWTGTVHEFVDYWFGRDMAPNQPLLALVDELRASGVQCWLASIQERHRLAYLLALPAFAGRFDGQLISCQLGVMKAEQEFWQKTLRRLPGTDPSQLLFVDDGPDNVAAARAAGLHAELYAGVEPLREVIAALREG